MASIVMDGNFSAQNRKMKNPHDDVPLADGHGFMVTTGPFREYLQEAGRRKMPVSLPIEPASASDQMFARFPQSQPSTCNDHRAVLTQHLKKANLESTGIGICACSRHGFFIPHTGVDFQKGEA